MEKKFAQAVVYDWKPSGCASCSSFSHNASSCPLLPAKPVHPRGRSRSHQARLPRRAVPSTSSMPSSSTPILTHLASPPHLPPPTFTTAPTALTSISEPLVVSSETACPSPTPPSKTDPPVSFSGQSSHHPLNDLNQPPLPSPPLCPPELPALPTSSNETLDLSSQELNPNSPATNIQIVSASPGHSHALRSLDAFLKSPSKEISDSTTHSSLASAAAQAKGKKKGKK